jgi:hypothetical protein
MSMRLKVECYSGYKANERPLRFSFAATGPEVNPGRDSALRTYEVEEVIDQWYGAEYQCFKVRAGDNNLYILRHHIQEDCWTLDSFRREERSLPSGNAPG